MNELIEKLKKEKYTSIIDGIVWMILTIVFFMVMLFIVNNNIQTATIIGIGSMAGLCRTIGDMTRISNCDDMLELIEILNKGNNK